MADFWNILGDGDFDGDVLYKFDIFFHLDLKTYKLSLFLRSRRNNVSAVF